MLAVTSFVFGAASAFFLPAATGLVPQTISAGRLQQANALLALSRSSVQVVGPGGLGLDRRGGRARLGLRHRRR